MAEIRSVVNQVLSQLGASREARYYLKQFSSRQFAVRGDQDRWRGNGRAVETTGFRTGLPA